MMPTDVMPTQAGSKWKNHSAKCRRYSLDESTFDVLNDETLYLLGLYMADGNIYQYKNRSASPVISLSLDEKDKMFLESVKKMFSSSHKIHLHNGAAYLSFSSSKIADALIALGITPRKSKSCKFDDALRPNLHVWRGVIDGDGWIGTKTDKRSYGAYEYPYLELNGSEALCKQFLKFLHKTTSFTGNVQKKQRTHRVSTCGRKAFTAIQILYPNGCFSIPRKRRAAKLILEKFGEKYVQ